MDNAEELQKLVGKIIIDAHFNMLQLQKQIKDLMMENNTLKEQVIQGNNIDGKPK